MAERAQVVKWYEWRTHTNRLQAWSRAVQGTNPYKVEFEPNSLKCPTAYTDFGKRLMRVNPEFAGKTPREQYNFTKALLSHEAGHKRFTTPDKSLSPLVAQISNILEDERIERLMEAEFSGVRPLLKRLNEAILDKAPELSPESENKGDVLNYALQWRWSLRSGMPVKGSLSTPNQALWALCEPLVRECWTAETSETSDKNAAEIARILDLIEPDSELQKLLDMLEQLEGERSVFDKAERGDGEPSDDKPTEDGCLKTEVTDSESEGNEKDAEESDEGEPMGGDPTPYEHGVGTPGHGFEPKPYMEMIAQAQPIADKLVEALRFDSQANQPEPVDRGGRFSMREYLKDEETPFLVQEERIASPTMAVRVIIDHSTSMGGHYEGKRDTSSCYQSALAAMAVHLACTELEIPHVVSITPDDIRVTDNDSGERGLALIAGSVPALTSYEDMGKTVRIHALELLQTNADWKVILAIHDGMTNDKKLLTKVCKEMRDKIVIIGIGIGPFVEIIRPQLLEEFGVDRLIIETDCSQIGTRLTNIIKNIRG